MCYADFYSIQDARMNLVDAIIAGYLLLSDYEMDLSEQDILYIKEQKGEKKNE